MDLKLKKKNTLHSSLTPFFNIAGSLLNESEEEHVHRFRNSISLLTDLKLISPHGLKTIQ